MIDLLVDVMATHRLARLATKDSLTAPLRDAVIARAYRRAGLHVTEPDDWTGYAQDDADAPLLGRLVSCRWCSSVWVAFGVVAARRLAPRCWSPIATALALSSASTFLAGLED